jgi:hypothetical protein
MDLIYDSPYLSRMLGNFKIYLARNLRLITVHGQNALSINSNPKNDRALASAVTVLT